MGNENGAPRVGQAKVHAGVSTPNDGGDWKEMNAASLRLDETRLRIVHFGDVLRALTFTRWQAKSSEDVEVLDRALAVARDDIRRAADQYLDEVATYDLARDNAIKATKARTE